jgi:capsular exopolysaccharide synthesis family protein
VGDGKSTTVANLAAVMAQAGQRVVVVSCDLRRPRAHHFFGLPNDPGFTSVLLGQCSLLDAVQRVPQLPNIVLVPSGPVPPNPSELLASKKAKQLFEQLESAADLVIIDCPPVLPVTDAQVLSEVADAVLLVVAAGRTTGREVQHAVRGLEQVNAPLIGTVFNDSKSGAQYGYTYGDDHDGPTLPDASAVVPSAADTANDPVEAR